LGYVLKDRVTEIEDVAGARLVITERAVQKHVTSIFVKLDLPGGDDANRRILAVLAYLSSHGARSGA
jgi:hypothetical protein